MYEIQQSLRQLSYFDVFGRLRLTLQLARVTLSIPMAIDQAMKEPDAQQTEDGSGEGAKKEASAGASLATQEDQDQPGPSDSRDDENGVASEGMSSDDDDSDEGEASVADDFGMREDDDDSNDDDGLDKRAQRKRDRRAQRQTRRRARVEAARQARIDEQQALQRKGLLGPTAASLLKGVVKVLETSEGWVPGAGSRGGGNDDE